MVTATATRQLTFGQAITEALRIAMREDPTVILLGEDIAGGATVDHLANDDAWGGPMGVTKGLVQEFGRDRVLDTPITEAGFIGAAVGAATTGLRPVAELMFVEVVRRPEIDDVEPAAPGVDRPPGDLRAVDAVWQ